MKDKADFDEGEKKREVLRGKEFFADLLEKINNAKGFIVVGSFLWRADDTGLQLASALNQAANRGVKILIIKDRLGLVFEKSEDRSKSALHSSDQLNKEKKKGWEKLTINQHGLSSLAKHGERISSFYGKNPGKLKGEKKIIRRKLRRNKNVEIIDDYKLYDHSKYFLVDDYGYVGGANIADEYNIGEVVKNGKNKGKRERPWQDHYTRIRGGKEYNRLVRVLTGEATKDLKVVEDIFLDKNEKNFPEEDNKKLREEMHYISDSELQKTGSSIDQFTLDFLDATKESLYVQLPYLGNRDYRIKIIELIKRGVKVFLVIPKNPNVNIWRNQHFLKDVYLWGDEKDSLSKLLSIFSLEGMNHTKMFVRDPYDEDNRAVEAGSHNGSLNTRRLSDFFKRLGWAFPKTSFNETNYVTGNKDVVDQQMKSFKKNISEGALVVPSVEYLENVGKIIDHFKEGEEDGVGDKVEEIVKENDKQKNKFSIFCRKLKEKVLFHLNRKNREKAVEFLESKDNSNNWLNIIKEKIEGEKVMFLEPWWSIFARSRAEWFGGVLQNFFYGFKKKETEKRRDEAQEAIARLVKNKWGGSSRE